MTKIISNLNCGNSPKMGFLMDFNIAFAKGDLEFIADSVTDEIVWNIIGNKKIEGKQKFAEELEKMKSTKVAELVLNQILSHGKQGAVNGTMKLQKGKEYAFSDFYIFQGAKVAKLKSITSYIIEI
ncbi:nuclear transport factor 2 family protein [Marivirga harenae]|uniref:nuclear transport factor 2 family protein n=1 Tax=Marivirga harenae TaxID=2010992 RepID=UPI0026DF5E71|nr:nuclear transport factor 2 family protein [Marivirga harenae]WKV13347.1 nuclear transport factor 2 family protein [Marivirga harenae]